MHQEIIVNGLRYMAPDKVDPNKPSNWKGFGGRRWTVRYHDHKILRTDDLMWDYSFKNGSKKDTAVILEGWTATEHDPICGWMQAGEYQVFGPLSLQAQKIRRVYVLEV